MSNVVICIKDENKKDRANRLAEELGAPVSVDMGEELTVLFDENGVSLHGYGLTYQGDFSGMLYRVSKGRLAHEMLTKVVKIKEENPKAIDATAGMGEDSFLLAAYGYEVTLYEQNPVVAELLYDSIERAKKDPELKDIVSRMTLVHGNSIEALSDFSKEVDLIYLDPMFPKRQKSGLINKKLQLIQKLEHPCDEEEKLFAAALSAKPKKIVVKRPLKGSLLADKKPNYSVKGKAIRYDCYAC